MAMKKCVLNVVLNYISPLKSSNKMKSKIKFPFLMKKKEISSWVSNKFNMLLS